MGRKELVFKILGLTTTVTFGILSLIMESRKKTKLTDEDKDDIAERVAKRIKPTRSKAPDKVSN